MNAPTLPVPAVALLFADVELARPLREALQELGARIAYEGPAGDVRGEDLVASRADVVVINLEDSELDHLDRLYDVLDGGEWRVIFNDAEASRDLSGWDRARWARHLASKLVGGDDVDPPRPCHDGDEMSAVDAELVTGSAEAPAAVSVARPEAVADPAPPEAAATSDVAETRSDELEAELAAFMDDAEVPADEVPMAGETSESTPDGAPVIEIEERQTLTAPAPVTDWELVDAEASPPATPERESARHYGVEKVDASEFLSPRRDEEEAHADPVFNLELVSLEESIAPAIRTEPLSEMRLDDSGAGIGHVVVVGAGRQAGAEVADFLSALPRTPGRLVLVVQHHDAADGEGVAQLLGSASNLPVKTAASGSLMARLGEVWLVPPGKRCVLKRDGRLQWDEYAAPGIGSNPSLDACIDALAPVFGAEITLVVMSGGGPDGRRAARQVATQGGQVWLHDAAAAADSGMARAIDDEGLATALGAPAELAARLNGEDA